MNANGRVYVANSKEDIQELFNKSEYYLTGMKSSDPIGTNYANVDFGLGVVNLLNTVGVFDNIEIIETGDIGSNNLPIFEVYGELRIFDTDIGKLFEESYNQNIVTIGMRSLGKQTDLYLPNFKLDKVICWDTIVR